MKSVDDLAGIIEFGRLLRAGEISCERVVEHYLAVIERLQPTLNAFITITADAALATARRLDRSLSCGVDLGPLHGVPIAYKDNIRTAHVLTTVGSAYLARNVPTEDAEVVRRLEGAGCIMLGKANMSEFASGSSGRNAFHGDVHNPWDIARSPGGSSSGTAVAVAAGMCMAGIGTDSGGSIRQPASRVGILGLRPTFGHVSSAGIYPRTTTLGVVGPMTRCASDAALLMNALADRPEEGRSPGDTSKVSYLEGIDNGIRGLRIGLIEDFSLVDIEPEVESAMNAAVDVLRTLDAKVVTVRVPDMTRLNYDFLFRTILLYEFNRIIGPDFRSSDNRDDLFGEAVRRDIENGEKISTETYEKLTSARAHDIRSFKAAFNEADVLLTPTLPNVPPLQSEGPSVWARGRQFNLPFSYFGVPSVSTPCGLSRSGLPIGMQFIGNHGTESLLLRFASAYDRKTGLSSRRPALYGAA
jgi:aspartyl-tRNA(Asn)/glutamyl-tRNA(Gln) amidotransferase subunit A